MPCKLTLGPFAALVEAVQAPLVGRYRRCGNGVDHDLTRSTTFLMFTLVACVPIGIAMVCESDTVKSPLTGHRS